MQNKIELYRQRDFGQVISTTFDFIRQNFKEIFKALLYICGPVLLLIAIFQNMYLSQYLRFSGDPSDPFSALSMYSNPYYYLTILLSVLEYSLMCCVIFGYISLYSKKGPGNVSFQDVLDVVKRKAGIIILSFIVMIIIIIVGYILLVIPGIYMSVALMGLPMFILHEELGIGDAISKAFTLIKGHWWQTFGIVIVLSLITYILILLISSPLLIFGGINALHSISSGENAFDAMGTVIQAFTIIASVLSLFAYLIIYTGIAVQYFSLSEEKFHVGAQQKVSELGNN
jgi:hypothetical protein